MINTDTFQTENINAFACDRWTDIFRHCDCCHSVAVSLSLPLEFQLNLKTQGYFRRAIYSFKIHKKWIIHTSNAFIVT